MSSELVFVRKEVLPKLLKHPLALPFKYPVDAITEGIYPDYFLVVHQPMDLYTVKSRLDHGWYWNLAHCLHDINLVWRNARLYNPADHPLHQWAVQMKTFTYALTRARGTHATRQTNKHHTQIIRMCRQIFREVLADSEVAGPFKIIPGRHSGHQGPLDGQKGQDLDLDHIEKKLELGDYQDVEAFADDIRRIVSETYRSCDIEDPMIKNAQQLSHKFEYEYARFIRDQEDQIKYDKVIAKQNREDHETEVLETMKKEVDAIEGQLSMLIQEEDCRISELKRRQTRHLVDKIANLDSRGIKDVLLIIQRDEEAKKQEDMEAEQEENEAEEGDMEDIEERQQHRSTSKAKDQHRSSSLEQDEDGLTLDFEAMDADTLNHLQEYIDNAK